ncbi:molybdate ABC transporter permease subunit [Sphingomonas aracearum]|uniref:Molybdenum transport system permease n=1 Tax=Sphingomonas aracearum TaxID=2283317 RepID=A0A369VYI7_9SPHN|nr:molybdate ABC transporter permease subunit [Sphingomonas aracearum]RDE07203.1 molybdate ABC transporter permease subunit [Sphingomonas aracearum]
MTGNELAIVALSLGIAARAVAVGLPLAVVAGWIMARRRFPGRVLVDAALHSSLFLPPVVVGFVLILLFGAQGPIGRLLDAAGVRLIFTTGGAALAAGVMAFPLMLRAAREAIAAVDPKLEAAAAGLGAGFWDRTFTVTLPLALPGLVAAGVIGFAAALGEFGAVITFAANIPGETQTLALAIYSALQVPGSEAEALRLAGFSFASAIGALLLSEALLAWGRRRAGT